jgi:hypothetical protein
MKFNLRVNVISFLMLMILFSLPIFGQETTGYISGTVRDQSGAVVPSASITVTNQQTGQKLTTTSDEMGAFQARELKPGRYAVEFQATGFSRGEVRDIVVMVGRTAQVDVKMEVSGIEQIISVTSTPIIDTSTTMVALNIPSEEFDRLPKSRSFRDLAGFQTSVNTGELEAGFQVNGASGAENNYYIDGVSTTSLIDGSARQDAVVEYVQEVQVKTTGLEAEYGGALGGVVSAVTKSGGNEFHGEAHYYYSGTRLSAGPIERLQLDPVTEESVAYIQDAKQTRDNHEFGFTLSGPIMKDKMWFFSSLSPQWNRGSNGYLFDNGATADTINRYANRINWFNKLSWDPTQRIRTNFTWLYSPTTLMGSLPAYDGFAPNVSTAPMSNAAGYRTRGYHQPEQSWTGNVDVTLSNTSMLSFKGGRYYLNYKENGIPYEKQYWWQSSSIGMEGVPPELQQPFNYATPSAARVLSDLTTRTFGQADFSQFVRFLGQHNFKVGVGVQKTVNNVFDSWQGSLGRVQLFWGLQFRGDGGQYGYYSVDDAATRGSAGATITHLYFQDTWKIHPRLTVNVGLRTEREVIPAFATEDAMAILGHSYAIKFGFGDKLAPRLGASFDALGNGKLKISGAWGRYFDWTKYDLVRGAFGGDLWHVYYRSLDTTDIYNIDLTNMPGRNLWTTGEYRNRRANYLGNIDPLIQPMSADVMNLAVDYEFRPQMVFSARYTRNKLNRTIEDLGALDAAGDEVYSYGNPGEGNNKVFPASGATCVVQVGEACGFNMPKAKRVYNALELSFTRRFMSRWLANVSYVYSDLWGNYAGLQSTDEIRPPTLGYGFGPAQVFGAGNTRSGGNANRYYDLDEALYDAHGNVGLYGQLPTDRPHVFKFYGSYQFSFGTELGGYYRIMSGTPVTTQVVSVNDIPVYVEGRGNLGRTPTFSQTDLVVSHELKTGESQKVRFEFNMDNLFNQKTSQFTFDRYNREEHSDSAGINLVNTDLSQGFDWQAMVAANGPGALDPRYKKAAIFNAGFSGRFLVKYIF